VLLGHGAGAHWAASFLNSEQPSEIQRLILIEPSLPTGFGAPIEEQLIELKLAIGDFYYQDQLLDRQQAELRRQSRKRAQQQGYSQVALKAFPGNREVEQEQLYRRVRGWLDQSTLAPAPSKP
jgi:hypothetical protein